MGGMVVASCETVVCMCGHGGALVRFSQVARKLFASRYFWHGAALVQLSQVACKPSSRRFSDGSVVASSFEAVACKRAGALPTDSSLYSQAKHLRTCSCRRRA